MNDDIKDDIKYVLLFIVGILFFCFLAFIALDHLGLIQCEKQANLMGLNYQYSGWTGCFVETDKGWFEISKVRYIHD